jgi:hypothetical protein
MVKFLIGVATTQISASVDCLRSCIFGKLLSASPPSQMSSVKTPVKGNCSNSHLPRLSTCC